VLLSKYPLAPASNAEKIFSSSSIDLLR